jgi:hypothetical protein
MPVVPHDADCNSIRHVCETLRQQVGAAEAPSYRRGLMKHRTVVHLTLALALASFGAVACGSDAPSQAATAEPGSTFCDLSQEARDIGSAIDPTTASPSELEDQVNEAADAAKKAAAAAPKDFEELADAAVEAQEAFIGILEDNDYDYVSAITSADAKELFGDPDYTQSEQDRDDYLLEKCEIEPEESNFQGDLELGSGDEGIRQIFQLLQFNDAFTITDDQIDCAVKELSGKISDEDLQAIANQTEVSEEGKQNFGLAVIACGIEIPQS